jgi:putative transposase
MDYARSFNSVKIHQTIFFDQNNQNQLIPWSIPPCRQERWSMDSTLSRDLVAHALKMAMRARQPGAGLVSHSDRGSQYASKDFQSLLKLYEMVCSMSRKGNCRDNSVVESFFGTLKQEHVYFCDDATREEVSRSIFEWTHGWYNRERIHSFLGNMSPEACERESVTA